MKLTSRYIDLSEFAELARQIPGTESLILVSDRLCLDGLVRASFADGICYSLHGVYALTEALGDAWMISNGELLKKYPLCAFRSATIVLKYVLKEFNFSRIQIQVPNDFHVRWCKSMGFEKPYELADRVFLSITK